MTIVYITTQFEGFHAWKDAPDEVAFLRDRHRHMFKVEVQWEVTHDDRQREFFIMQRETNAVLAAYVEEHKADVGSCEMIARWLKEKLGACAVQVSEDGENGAIVIE